MKILFTLLVVFLFGTSLNAQELLRKVGQTAKNKVEQQDFNTTRNNKERSNNLQNEKTAPAPASAPAPEPSPETENQEMDSAAAVQTANSMQNGSATSKDLIYKESYDFNGKVTYDIEDLKKAKKNTITYHYSQDAICTEVVDMKSCSIFDYTNEVMINFDESAKTATVMSASFMNKATAQAADNHDQKVGGTTVTKTGLTKKILGYNCDNYIATNGDGSKTDFWITTDITIDNDKLIASTLKNMKTQPGGDMPTSGVMMEFTSYNTKSVAETHMIMTDYNTDTFTKALANYKVTKIGF